MRACKSQPKRASSDIRRVVVEMKDESCWPSNNLLSIEFDINSHGKWIHDWTVHHHGVSTPMADVTGNLLAAADQAS
jgi:hypothetical protein